VKCRGGRDGEGTRRVRRNQCVGPNIHEDRCASGAGAEVEGSARACYVGGVDDEDLPRRTGQRPTPPPVGHEGSFDTLPVVARMVVEIRSDGTRTIARGALDDRTSGQQIAIELSPSSPWAMAKGIAKLLLATPSTARSAVKSVLRRRGDVRRRLRGTDDG
jgi:hypothetical protein